MTLVFRPRPSVTTIAVASNARRLMWSSPNRTAIPATLHDSLQVVETEAGPQVHMTYPLNGNYDLLANGPRTWHTASTTRPPSCSRVSFAMTGRRDSMAHLNMAQRAPIYPSTNFHCFLQFLAPAHATYSVSPAGLGGAVGRRWITPSAVKLFVTCGPWPASPDG